MSLALASRFRANVAVVAMAAAGSFAVSAINAHPRRLPRVREKSSTTRRSRQSPTREPVTKFKHRSKGTLPAEARPHSMEQWLAMCRRRTSPVGVIYVRNGMGLKGSVSAGWSWSYYVYP